MTEVRYIYSRVFENVWHVYVTMVSIVVSDLFSC